MLESMLWAETDCIIEGESVLPELIDELLKKHPNSIKICFVGYPNASIDEKIKAVYEYSDEKKDWLTKESKQYVEDHIRNMVAYSKRIEKSCKQYGIKYFDTSKNFIATLDNAIVYLLEKKR